MPTIGGSQALQKFKASNFGFSATRMNDLGAGEYTLVTIIADRSGSTTDFQKEMEACIKEIVGACMKSPRADNLMIRLVTFESNHAEVHGFKLLSSINLADYDNVLHPGGMTALFDAAVDGIEATNVYGRTLSEQDIDVNGIIFVITDGMNNSGVCGMKQVKDAFAQSVRSENLDSMVSILIAVNVQDPSAKAELEKFNVDAGFTQYVELPDAKKGTLAKLAQFVSKSISSQSQNIGSGAAPASITF